MLGSGGYAHKEVRGHWEATQFLEGPPPFILPSYRLNAQETGEGGGQWGPANVDFDRIVIAAKSAADFFIRLRLRR